MTKEVVLTPLAKSDLENIVSYLIKFWNLKTASAFINRFEKLCSLITSNAEIYPYLSKERQIRKCVISKHNSLYFTLINDKVYVLAIFDTRQNPEKLDL